MTEPLRSSSPHSWHLPEPSLKTTKQGSQPKETSEPAGKSEHGPESKSQGRENITHRETGSSSYGGSQGLCPTGEDRAVFLQYQLDQCLMEQGSWARKSKMKKRREQSSYTSCVLGPQSRPSRVK